MKNPCVKHPDTGKACPMLNLPKGGHRCRSCVHRIRYTKASGRDGFVPQSQEPAAAPAASARSSPHCAWPGCDDVAYYRGMCRNHYRRIQCGKLFVSFEDTSLQKRFALFGSIAMIANKHGIGFDEAAAILIDEGVLQYRKRAMV